MCGADFNVLGVKLRISFGYIQIDDKVTSGLLQTLILVPSTYLKISFSAVDVNFNGIQVSIKWLNEYWQQNDVAAETLFSLVI